MEKVLLLHDWLTDWRLKALLQFTFSFIPRGEQLNYVVQRYVMGSLPASDREFTATVSYAKRHINALQHSYDRRLTEATFYEFGAGWDMTIPLAYYGFGIANQIVIDIRNLIKVFLVNDAIHKYQSLAFGLKMPRITKTTLDCRAGNVRTELKKHYGIDYRAPCDARQTGLPSRSIDCITSTNTLEHIPQQDICLILAECRRILCDDGVMSLLIDYDDHYSYYDPNISSYNFLKYSDQVWSVFNPPLHYQNRMRHRDYVTLFQNAGFDIVEQEFRGGSDTELKTIQRLSIAKRFKEYSWSDLAAHNALIVLRKRHTA